MQSTLIGQKLFAPELAHYLDLLFGAPPRVMKILVEGNPALRELNNEVTSLDSGFRRNDEFDIAKRVLKVVVMTPYP